MARGERGDMLEAPRLFINESGDCECSQIWLIIRSGRVTGSQSICGVLNLTFECDFAATTTAASQALRGATVNHQASKRPKQIVGQWQYLLLIGKGNSCRLLAKGKSCKFVSQLSYAFLIFFGSGFDWVLVLSGFFVVCSLVCFFGLFL